MNVLVTGSAGFIGSHLVDYLEKKGHDVTGVDNYSIGRYEHPKTIEADLRTKEIVDVIVGNYKPDVIFHMAAWAHEGLSQFSPMLITENNYNTHINLLTAAIKHKVKRIIVASSMSVYGDQKPPFTEKMKRRPADIYAVSKTAMEESTEILARVHGIEYVIVRPHNVYGPRQALHDPYRNVVAIFINSSLQGKSFYIYGDGEQKRAFSYVDDVVPYIAKTGWGNYNKEIFNIGPLEEFTVNQLASEVSKHFPKNPKPIHLPDRPLEVKYAWSSNDKAIKDLGYKTKTSFSEGIAKMVKWAKKMGYQQPVYLDSLELEAPNMPETWSKKLI